MDKSTKALFDTVISRDFGRARSAIEAGADVNAKDEKGFTPLNYTLAEYGPLGNSLEVVSYDDAKLIIEHSNTVSVNTSAEGQTPLYRAALNVDEEIVELLIEKGADINATNEYGCTALHVAAEIGAIRVVKILLDNGADINATDDSKATPLHTALNSEYSDVDQMMEIVKLLLEKGANVHANEYEFTPLQLVVSVWYVTPELVEVVKLLLKHSVNISREEMETLKGFIEQKKREVIWSALHSSAQAGFIAENLIDVNIADKDISELLDKILICDKLTRILEGAAKRQKSKASKIDVTPGDKDRKSFRDIERHRPAGESPIGQARKRAPQRS